MLDWSKSHNGVILCDYDRTIELMPEVKPLLEDIRPYLQYDYRDYLIDVKVHMLMPGQYPCIPNWHCDFVPRDDDKKKLLDKILPDDMMYLYVSGEPKTEFKTYQRRIHTHKNGSTWTAINQRDVHRGVKSEVFTW